MYCVRYYLEIGRVIKGIDRKKRPKKSFYCRRIAERDPQESSECRCSCRSRSSESGWFVGITDGGGWPGIFSGVLGRSL